MHGMFGLKSYVDAGAQRGCSPRTVADDSNSHAPSFSSRSAIPIADREGNRHLAARHTAPWSPHGAVVAADNRIAFKRFMTADSRRPFSLGILPIPLPSDPGVPGPGP